MEPRAPWAGPARRRQSWVIVALAVTVVASLLATMRPDPAHAVATITEYSTGISAGASPLGITPGPNGDLWFAEPYTDSIGRITPGGVATEYTTGISPGSWPRSIVLGPDSNFWFTESRGLRIGKIVPSSGAVVEYSGGIGSTTVSLGDIASGSDGALWFTMARGVNATPAIGRIVPATGLINVFTAGFSGGQLGEITPGATPPGSNTPDPNLWFTITSSDRIGRITPGGTVTEFPVGGAASAQPYGITAGPDGNVWFALSGPTGGLGRITPAGVVTRFPSGGSPAVDLVAGDDGFLWFTQYPSARVGRMRPTGELVTYASGIGSGTRHIARAASGLLWFTEPDVDKLGSIFDLASIPTTTIAASTTTTTTTSTTTTTTTTIKPTTTTIKPTTTTTSTTTTIPTTPVAAGGTLSSDPSGAVPSPSNPVLASVTTPNAGGISITKTTSSAAPPGFTSLGVRFAITAPAAFPTAPLEFVFSVATSKLPAAANDRRVTALRNGSVVADCTSPDEAEPDPCVASRQRVGSVLEVAVRSSLASTWEVLTTPVGRLAGADRIATAVAVSKAARPGGGAPAAVLARSDAYPDALAGGPLAAAKGGTLLLTPGASLPESVESELVRVVKPNGTVYLLGGTNAITPAVATRLTKRGFVVRRLAGADRYATSVTIAKEIGNPARFFLATGTGFADALSAGPAAAVTKGAVLLTAGSTLPGPVSAYLAARKATPRVAVGGAAAKAVPTAEIIAGTNRYETSSMLAMRFFPAATAFGLASGDGFADALAGAPLLGPAGSPLVITSSSSLAAPITTWLRSNKAKLTGGGTVLGGTAAIPEAVRAAAAAALG